MTNTAYPPHISVATIDRDKIPPSYDLWLEKPLITMHIEVTAPEWSSTAWELVRPEGGLLIAPPSGLDNSEVINEEQLRVVRHDVADIPRVVAAYLGLINPRSPHDLAPHDLAPHDLAPMVVALSALRAIPDDADSPMIVIDALAHAAVDAHTAAGIALLLAARRFSWQITSICNRSGEAEEHCLSVVDAGPFGLWRLDRGSESLCLSPIGTRDAVNGIVGLLRAC
jgi:hypothetical protein